MGCCYKNGAERHRSGVSIRISILMLLLAVLLFMKRQELVFDSTEVIEISSSRSVGHRIVETELVCTHSNGSVQRIPVGDQLLQALPDVVTFAKKSGVLIRDLR